MATTMATGMAGPTPKPPSQIGLRSGRARSRDRRLPIGSLLFVIVVLVWFAGFAVALQVSLAGAFRSTRPQLALMVAPLDAAARARLAGQLALSDQAEAKAAARNLGIDAIRRDALQPVALRAIALAGERSDPQSRQSTLGLMMQSQRLSRRDVMTQMWLVEHFGRLNQFETMVYHFDLALRSSESARASVFSLLAAAAADPSGEEIVIRTLSRRPNWAIPFVAFSIGQGQDLEFVVRTARLLLDPRKPEDRARYLALLNRLAAERRYDLAWSLYVDPALALGAPGKVPLRDGTFEGRAGGTPFDWSLMQEAELWASTEPKGGGTILRMAAYNGRSGDVAWQLLRLNPGMYRVALTMGDIPADTFERPEVRITCAERDQDRSLMILKPAQAGVGPRRVEGGVIVPSGCTFQRISIALAGEGSFQEPTPWVDDISID